MRFLLPEDLFPLLVNLMEDLHDEDIFASHSFRVGELAYALGSRMGIEDPKLYWAGVFHDYGKLFVPKRLLELDGSLLDLKDWAVLRQHTVLGWFFLRFYDPVLSVVARHHHERWDGTGYPDRLSGEEIPLYARIVAVADAFDAMISSRPYRAPKVSLDEALREIQSLAGIQFDPVVVSALPNVMSPLGEVPGNLVRPVPSTPR